MAGVDKADTVEERMGVTTDKVDLQVVSLSAGLAWLAKRLTDIDEGPSRVWFGALPR